MANQKSLGRFLFQCFLLAVLFLATAPLITSFRGRLFKFEILLFLFLLLLSLIGFFGCRSAWGERVLFFVFLISLFNVVFVWHFTNKLFMLHLFLGLLGFLTSLPKKCCCESSFCETVDQSSVPEFKEETEAKVEIIDESKEKKSKRTVFSPGKYVASKMSNVYHAPTCDWAKKIAEERRVWFKDKREAGRKKYKPHSCVE